MSPRAPVLIEAARMIVRPASPRHGTSDPAMKATPRGAALITGATSGLGYEFARLCAAAGYRLALVGRNRRRLLEIASEIHRTFGVTVDTFPADLASDGAPGRLHAALARRKLPVELFIDNAGVGTWGRFHEISLEDDLQLLRLNVVASSALAKLIARDMAMRRRGRILIVSSAAAFQPGPLMATYYASKSYLLSLATAMRKELRGTGVSVTAFCPGVTKTDFHRRAHMMNSRLVAHRLMDARHVADVGFAALMRGKAIVVPGLQYKIFALLVRLVPRTLAATVAMKMQEPVH